MADMASNSSFPRTPKLSGYPARSSALLLYPHPENAFEVYSNERLDRTLDLDDAKDELASAWLDMSDREKEVYKQKFAATNPQNHVAAGPLQVNNDGEMESPSFSPLSMKAPSPTTAPEANDPDSTSLRSPSTNASGPSNLRAVEMPGLSTGSGAHASDNDDLIEAAGPDAATSEPRKKKLSFIMGGQYGGGRFSDEDGKTYPAYTYRDLNGNWNLPISSEEYDTPVFKRSTVVVKLDAPERPKRLHDRGSDTLYQHRPAKKTCVINELDKTNFKDASRKSMVRKDTPRKEASGKGRLVGTHIKDSNLKVFANVNGQNIIEYRVGDSASPAQGVQMTDIKFNDDVFNGTKNELDHIDESLVIRRYIEGESHKKQPRDFAKIAEGYVPSVKDLRVGHVKGHPNVPVYAYLKTSYTGKTRSLCYRVSLAVKGNLTPEEITLDKGLDGGDKMSTRKLILAAMRSEGIIDEDDDSDAEVDTSYLGSSKRRASARKSSARKSLVNLGSPTPSVSFGNQEGGLKEEAIAKPRRGSHRQSTGFKTQSHSSVSKDEHKLLINEKERTIKAHEKTISKLKAENDKLKLAAKSTPVAKMTAVSKTPTSKTPADQKPASDVSKKVIVYGEEYKLYESGPNIGKLASTTSKTVTEDGKNYKEWKILVEYPDMEFKGTPLARYIGVQTYTLIPDGTHQNRLIQAVPTVGEVVSKGKKYVEWAMLEEIEGTELVL